ncbi:hypothetical protein E4U42_003673 [Claviceps africana]|uniref:Uncharacterized protein n=1 Tax=Claviceps africana TaxID=83212 RepID=A0A8K0J6Q1_9HYPO|nr:hypothetical protein E4U42_003673 [Claviceps africana]
MSGKAGRMCDNVDSVTRADGWLLKDGVSWESMVGGVTERDLSERTAASSQVASGRDN